MKIKNILIGASSLLLAAGAFAQTDVRITGASAFRVSTLDSIKAQFDASGQPYRFAHDRNTAGGQSFNGGTRVIFEGTFPGVTGTTIIRTSFNGSVEGINALLNSPTADPTYLETSVLSSETATIGGNNGGLGKGSTSSPTEALQSDYAFSDVGLAATPFAGAALQPANPEAGVVIFTMIANEGAPAALNNITAQQFRALFGAGYLPLSYFTGNVADDPFGPSPGANAALVVATGRNDGSGTRTSYMAETGVGITTLIQQYAVTAVNGNEITQIRLTGPAFQPSTLWTQNEVGNGGYSSGSALRDDMGRASPSVEILDADGNQLIDGVKVHLVTWLSLGDAGPARTAGAKILGYNGETLSGFAATSTRSAADAAKVQNGTYTAWSFQQFYRRNDITTGDKVTVYNAIKNNLVLGNLGLEVPTMRVTRSADGGTVNPL